MTELGYAELVRELFPRLTGGIRWGTDRVDRLLAEAGDVHRRYRSIHVGGTNGKGSTSTFLASILEAAGERVGLYTSPHLCTFRERIRLNGEPASEEAVVGAARRLWPLIQAAEPSFFEATTAIAFQLFADADVETAVVEVGLGGRLDATNVLSPDVVVLTNVSLDHADFLGESLPEVAAEKAGILKAGVPVVMAERDPVVLEVFERRAVEVGAPLTVLDPSDLIVEEVSLEGTSFRLRTRRWGELRLRTRLVGEHQAYNAALAVLALEHRAGARPPDEEALRRGIERARVDGRFQVERIGAGHWIFDVAHNPVGVEALASTLERLQPPRPWVAVIGVLADKDWSAMLPRLVQATDRAVLTQPESAPSARRWDLETVARDFAGEGVETVETMGEALERAAKLAGRGTVVVTGSFHTVGDALILLGLREGDPSESGSPRHGSVTLSAVEPLPAPPPDL